MEIKSFQELALPEPLLKALKEMNFDSPTAVQSQAIPAGLEGKDILAIAPTGTGKTGAFSIPAVSFLYPNPGKQVLILAPTRELAAQINRFLKKLADPLKLRSTLIVGGESYSRQRNEVKGGVDFIIATPGRLMDHINRGMPIENISILVLDEVDRMLDMGFAPQVEQIVKVLPPKRQTYLFSATMPTEIVKLVNKYLKDPVRIKVESTAAHAPKIKEENIETTDVEKPRLVVDQVAARSGKILVFANTQGRVEQVARRLTHSGHPAECIHGGRTHRERKSSLEAFRSGDIRILVATDIVARGIDVTDVEHVINYDYPATHEDYLHRIGRTGRIGKEGSAITFNDPKRRRQKSNTAKSLSPEPRKFDRKPGRRQDTRPFKREDRPRFEKSERPFKREDRPRFEKSERPFKREDRPRFERAERPFKREDRPRFEKSERSFKREDRPFREKSFSGEDKPVRSANVYRAGKSREGVPAPVGRKKSFEHKKGFSSPVQNTKKPWVRASKGTAVRRSKPSASL